MGVSTHADEVHVQRAITHLEPHRARLSWLGDSELGFARHVPNGLGPELDGHFEWLLKVDLRGTNLEGRMADAMVQRTGEPPSETNGNQGGEDWME